MHTVRAPRRSVERSGSRTTPDSWALCRTPRTSPPRAGMTRASLSGPRCDGAHTRGSLPELNRGETFPGGLKRADDGRSPRLPADAPKRRRARGPPRGPVPCFRPNWSHSVSQSRVVASHVGGIGTSPAPPGGRRPPDQAPSSVRAPHPVSPPRLGALRHLRRRGDPLSRPRPSPRRGPDSTRRGAARPAPRAPD